MQYLILGLAILIGGYFLVRGIRRTNPKNIQRNAAVVISLLMAVVIGFLTLTGRLGPFGWALFVLPMILRWRAILRGLKNMRGPTPGANSDIETLYLRMTLDHDSGVLSGTVIKGNYGGKTLDELSLEQLVGLLHECRMHDPQSVSVLEAYLDRVHGAGWRETADGTFGNGAKQGGAAAMTPQQAYEILGLQPGASHDEIRAAHRSLLKSNHPDRGGSTWLAAQINLAKDTLLGS